MSEPVCSFSGPENWNLIERTIEERSKEIRYILRRQTWSLNELFIQCLERDCMIPFERNMDLFMDNLYDTKFDLMENEYPPKEPFWRSMPSFLGTERINFGKCKERFDIEKERYKKQILKSFPDMDTSSVFERLDKIAERQFKTSEK